MRLIRLLKNDLAREAADWVEESIVSEAQAQAICRRYDVDYHQLKNRAYGYGILVGLACLFVGLAVITILGANWDDIPRAVRMGGLIVLTLATQSLGLRKYLAGDRAAAEGVFLLGNLFYGASIALIAQIYHLGEHMPDGIFLWALGSLPFAIVLKSPLLMLLSVILALIWFFVESNMGFYPALFPLFICGALYVLAKGRPSVTLLLVTVASIGLWFEYSLSELWRESRYFHFGAEHLAVSVALFILLYAFSHWLGRKDAVVAKDYGAVLALWSLRFGLFFMLVMSFLEPWERLINAQWEHRASMVVLAAVFSAAALYLARPCENFLSVIAIVSVYLLTLLALLVATDDGAAVYFQVACNLALVGLGVRLVMKGIQAGISHYFFLGVAAILLTALMRYIDLIGDYVGGALLFIVFAVLLFGAARYWKTVADREAGA